MYRFLDHPSEALIEVRANSLEEVFEEAAHALFEVMTDISQLRPEKRFEVVLEDSDRSQLLIDWLNRLILLHEVEKVFLCEFRVRIWLDQVWKLRAEMKGEQIQGRHEKRSQVKSATFGLFQWEETLEGYRVCFVLDI